LIPAIVVVVQAVTSYYSWSTCRFFYKIIVSPTF